jgi:hypothetical protein
MKIDVAPPCFYLSLVDTSISIDSSLHLSVGVLQERYALRGVIYLADQHFTSRILKPNGDVWYHDGITTGRTSSFEGSVHGSQASALNVCDRTETVGKAVGVIYARMYA